MSFLVTNIVDCDNLKWASFLPCVVG